MEQKRNPIHTNLISEVEMKAHTKEMRAEMDRKFVGCLMATGLTKLEGVNRLKVWNAEREGMHHGN